MRHKFGINEGLSHKPFFNVFEALMTYLKYMGTQERKLSTSLNDDKTKYQ